MKQEIKAKKHDSKNLGCSSEVELAIGRIFSKMTYADVKTSELRKSETAVTAICTKQSNAPSMDAECAVRKIKEHLKYADRMDNIEKQIRDQFTSGFLSNTSVREEELQVAINAIPGKCLDLPVSENMSVRDLLRKVAEIAQTDQLKQAVAKKLE